MINPKSYVFTIHALLSVRIVHSARESSRRATFNGLRIDKEYSVCPSLQTDFKKTSERLPATTAHPYFDFVILDVRTER